MNRERFTLEDTYRFGGESVNPVEKYRMDNGLTVLIHDDPRAPVVAYHTWYGVGSSDETDGRTGMAHLFEHLMFKETKNLAEGEFDRLMEGCGAQTNAATWVDWTYYYQKLPIEHLELPFRLEADRMENMILGSEQLEAEREVVMSERRLRVDMDPDGKIYESLYAGAYGRKHPYGWPTIGWMSDIEAITLEDCHAFYRTYYAPNNAVVVVVGDVRADHVLSLIEQYYGHLQAQSLPAMKETVPRSPGEQSIEIEVDTAAERVVVAYPSPPMKESGYYVAEVLLEVLLNSDSARLTRKLVLEQELATSASGWIAGFRHPGLFHIDVNARPGVSAEQVQEVLDEEIATLLADGVTEKELTRAINKLEAEEVKQLLSAGSIAYNLGYYETTCGDFRSFFNVVDKIRSVTAEDLMAFATGLLDPQKRTAVIARPATGEKAA